MKETKTGPAFTDDLEEKAIESSRNIFKLAEEALTVNKNLKTVVIMEHPPRFDDKIKSKLAELANILGLQS